MESYHILSLEAKDIYKSEQINGVEQGYVLPEKNGRAYFDLFKNVLDYSLDLIELKNVYEKQYRRKTDFDFKDKYQNQYTFEVINLKFNYTYEDNDNKKDLKELRKYFYENGFNFNGIHYARYKRSSGSSRQGNCLFIDEKLLKPMEKWGECGLKHKGDLLDNGELVKKDCDCLLLYNSKPIDYACLGNVKMIRTLQSSGFTMKDTIKRLLVELNKNGSPLSIDAKMISEYLKHNRVMEVNNYTFQLLFNIGVYQKVMLKYKDS